MKHLSTIFTVAAILLVSCSEKIERPENQLLNELKEKVSEVNQVSNVYLIQKSDFLCKHIDCNKRKLSIDGYEFLVAGPEDMFMYGHPDYFVLESWNEDPQVRWVDSNR